MEKGNNVEENSFKIMIKNFANFMKNIHLQTDNVEWNANRQSRVEAHGS